MSDEMGGGGGSRKPKRGGARAVGAAHPGIAEIQRARLLSAMFDACAEHGAANVSVAHVVESARVSRRTFYELFTDREECLLAAIDDGVERVAAAVVPAWNGDGPWRQRIRASLTELLHALDNDPVTGRLLLVDTLGAGHEALERRRDVLAPIIAAVDHGRREAKSATHTVALTAEGIVGAVMSVLHARMLEGSGRSLLDLTGPLMSMIVLPYLGPGAARRELTRPAPERRARPPAPSHHPLNDIPMRITYRTMCVLDAIALDPGASNRQTGAAAGIDDQGQISKLLSRLERLGLIENKCDDGARGMPNSWHLTKRGAQVHGTFASGAARGEASVASRRSD